MNSQLVALKKLQESDRDLRSLLRARQACPARLEEDLSVTRAKREEIARLEETIKGKRMGVESAELEVRSNREKVNELQIKLNTASTNEEYAILQSQIRKLDEELEPLEDSALEELDAIEELEKGQRRLEEELATLEQEYERNAEMVRAEINEIDAQLRECEGRRAEASRAIEGELLRRYERILERHGDSALALVEHQVCLGCHMSITTQTLNEILAGHEIIECPNCFRILFIEE